MIECRTAEELSNALGGKRSGAGYMACCPAHDDHEPSLSIKDGDKGVVVHCLAGCGQRAVLDALREREISLGPSRDNGDLRLPPGVFSSIDGESLESWWEYKSAAGKTMGYVARYPTATGKTIRPFFVRDGAKWKAGVGAGPRPLYHLDKLDARPDAPVMVTEGEKAADAAARLLPAYVSTTSPGGSGAADKADWGPLKGRRVTIWPDNDEPGTKYAAAVFRLVTAAGAESVSMIDVAALDLPPKGDAADWKGALPDPLPLLSDAARITASEEPKPAAFARVAFPIEVLPDAIAESLKRLARSCACSLNPIPGAAFAMIGAALGRTVAVKPKDSWDEPLIFWHGDIRDSGEGKTAPAQSLAAPFYARQRAANQQYQKAKKEWKKLPAKERKDEQEPDQQRAYFMTNLTVESLRNTGETGHGGLLVIKDELSGMISGQNQYRNGKGDDREAWLNLWNGTPIMVGRVETRTFIEGLRISVFGGIQPVAFRAVFDRLLQNDGTLFRFLLTYSPPEHHELTAESWAEEDRKTWTATIDNAMNWADERPLDKPPYRLSLNKIAQTAFMDWRNELDVSKTQRPPEIRGFIPKATSYALRLTGAIHCLHAFAAGEGPSQSLTLADFERGRQVVEFYLGQVSDAMRLLSDADGAGNQPVEVSERSIHLARVLAALKPELDSGRLAVGYIHQHWNATCEPHLRMKSPRAMGALIRSCGLTIANGAHDANGKRAVRCLTWDKKTEGLTETRLQCLQSLSTAQPSASADADIENAMSAMSASAPEPEPTMQTLQTLKNQCLHPETSMVKPKADNADIADVVSTGRKKCEDCRHAKNRKEGKGNDWWCTKGHTWPGLLILHACDDFAERKQGGKHDTR